MSWSSYTTRADLTRRTGGCRRFCLFVSRMQGWSAQFQDTIAAIPKSMPEGPLAHRVEQGTFNPKVPGSSPGRPTSSKHMYDARPLFDKLSPNTGPNNCWDR